MNLNYNIGYEVTGVLFSLVLLVYMLVLGDGLTNTQKYFRKAVFWNMIGALLDIITAFTDSNPGMVPVIVNILLNSLYVLSITTVATYFSYYITDYIADRTGYRYSLKPNYILYAIYCVLLIINVFTGFLFGFDAEGVYCRGDWWIIIPVLPIFAILHATIVMIIWGKAFERKHRVAIELFFIICVTAIVVQTFLVPLILLSFMASSLSMLIVFLTMETPDYRALVNNMRELELARQAADDANRYKQAFLANMSHEIRTPINAILGMDEMILRECTNSEVCDYAMDIETAGKNLLSIINDILDMTKIESGKMEIVCGEYELSSLINDSCTVVSLLLSKKGLDFSLVNDRHIPDKLYGDEVRIRQILTNILTNAIKYTDEGSVSLSIDWDRIDDGNMILKFAVSDTGMGISEESQKYIFDDFQRVEGESVHHIEGTGLGLPITKKLVEMMDGRISVESVVGEGSTFVIELPQRILSDAPMGDYSDKYNKSRDNNMANHVPIKADDCTILVVDDLEVNLKVLKGFLKNTGIMVDCATSGVQCISMASSKKYDIILLDHMMPNMSGVETFRELRKLENNPNLDTPVIMLTANAVVGAKDEYLEQGFDGYLSKPVRSEKLEKMLIDMLPDKVSRGQAKVTGTCERAEQENGSCRDCIKEKADDVFGMLREVCGLDTDSGIMYCASDSEVYLEVIEEYVNNDMIAMLEQYYEDNKWTDYARTAHSLKSNTMTIGNIELSDMFKELELAAKADDIALIRDRHSLVVKACRELIHKISDLI